MAYCTAFFLVRCHWETVFVTDWVGHTGGKEPCEMLSRFGVTLWPSSSSIVPH